MSVGFDAQLTVGTATGIGTYQRELAAALAAAGTPLAVLREPRLDPWRFDRRVVWDQALLPVAAARSGARLLHATAGTMPALASMPVVLTVHDCAWLRVQQHTRPYARAYFGALQARLARRARAIVADSAFTAAEIDALIAPRGVAVHVVHLGVDAWFASAPRTPERERPFALVSGTVERRKNLLAIVEALPHVPGLDIVSVGPPTPYADEVRARAAALGVADRVRVRGYVAVHEYHALVERAAFALVPSRYEGFGYALAEALVAGIPVAAARSSSLVEVADGDALLVEADDRDGWVEVMRALRDGGTRAQMRAAELRARHAARFRWTRCAAETAAVYASVDR